ncbi:MAG: hypothetical protein Q4G34_01420 [Micrococcus sp.]|nr:hypothetical protein [Micrococcus sp.]
MAAVIAFAVWEFHVRRSWLSIAAIVVAIVLPLIGPIVALGLLALDRFVVSRTRKTDTAAVTVAT